jgi:CheY-like chemotaxis protein
VSAVVLVADDNHEFLRVVRRLLTERTAPVDVRTVETGERALAFLVQDPGWLAEP